MSFPTIRHKQSLDCQTLLDDQIIVIDNFLSPAECKDWVKFIDALPLELTPPKKRGEADRLNYRHSIASQQLADKLYALMLPHLPSFPYPSHLKRKDIGQSRKPDSFNSNIRFYKYTPSQHFGPHYDDSVKDPVANATSEWTLLIYLTGVEDGVQGGETMFYRNAGRKAKQTIIAPLTRGTALLHRHGHDCLLHEGSKVLKGTKYVLRSDLMFK